MKFTLNHNSKKDRDMPTQLGSNPKSTFRDTCSYKTGNYIKLFAKFNELVNGSLDKIIPSMVPNPKIYSMQCKVHMIALCAKFHWNWWGDLSGQNFYSTGIWATFPKRDQIPNSLPGTQVHIYDTCRSAIYVQSLIEICPTFWEKLSRQDLSMDVQTDITDTPNPVHTASSLNDFKTMLNNYISSPVVKN